MPNQILKLKIKSVLKIATTICLCCCFLFFLGCASLIDKMGGSDFPSPEETIQTQDITPVNIADIDGGEIEYLPLIPLEDRMAGKNEQSSGKKSQNGKIQSRIDKSLEFYQSSQEYWQQGELENALDALDKSYALIVSTETFDIPKFIQQKDDLRFMISKRILEIYASRYTTVKGNHNAIPIVMNKHVEKELEHFTKGNAREFFLNSYQRSGLYRPHIVEELKKAGLPEELSWLPLIESGYKVKALSSARALGMWQFIASTGYKFGLKRDRYIDERLDPYKSTQAAIAYLKELHEIFGDWKTVLAAYNCGEGRVLREIRKQNINYLDDFWDLYEHLPLETAQYVPRFIATLHIVNNPEQYGLDKIAPETPIAFETALVQKQAALKDVAKVLGLTEDELTGMNPELRYKVLPDEEYELKVPVLMAETLLSKLDEIQETYQSPYNIAYHRVRPGETLSTIAQRYKTTVKKIAWYNNLYRQNYIVTGQVLKIPQAGEFAVRGKTTAAPKLVTYHVQRGDSLWLLAKRYNTTTKKIEVLNKLKSVNLHVGQVLNIPTGNQDIAVYEVKQGDSPFSIARQHNMDVDELLKINHLSKNSRIYPGQTLYVQ